MYFTDPTLYGATLPQKEIATPFYGQYGQYGQMMPPWQNLQMQHLPFQQVPYQQLPVQNLPWQNVPVQSAAWQQFAAPMYQHGVAPYFKPAYGYPASFATAPYAAASGFHPYVQSGAAGFPLYGWQRPWA